MEASLFRPVLYYSWNSASYPVKVISDSRRHNMENKSYKYWLVIEYNPNKNDISTSYLNKILKYFYNNYAVLNFYDIIVTSAFLTCHHRVIILWGCYDVC